MGVYLYSNNGNVSGNKITKNNISTNGTSSCYGMYLRAIGTGQIMESQITGNSINSNGRTGGSNFGVYLFSSTDGEVSGNKLSGNQISTKGATASNYGVYSRSNNATSGNTSSNTFSDNNITTNGTGPTMPCTSYILRPTTSPTITSLLMAQAATTMGCMSIAPMTRTSMAIG